MSLLSGRYVRSLLSHVLWIYLYMSCIWLTGFYHFSHVYFSSGICTLLLYTFALSLSLSLGGHNCQINIFQSLYRYFSIQKIWMVVKNMVFWISLLLGGRIDKCFQLVVPMKRAQTQQHIHFVLIKNYLKYQLFAAYWCWEVVFPLHFAMFRIYSYRVVQVELAGSGGGNQWMNDHDEKKTNSTGSGKRNMFFRRFDTHREKAFQIKTNKHKQPFKRMKEKT